MTDEQQIRRSLALLCQLRDDDHYDRWIELFAEDGKFSYLEYSFTGRADIRAHCEKYFPAYGKHLCLNSVIEIEGDQARVTSDFVKLHPAEKGAPASGGAFVVAGAGRYNDRFVRNGEKWLLAERRVVVMQ